MPTTPSYARFANVQGKKSPLCNGQSYSHHQSLMSMAPLLESSRTMASLPLDADFLASETILFVWWLSSSSASSASRFRLVLKLLSAGTPLETPLASGAGSAFGFRAMSGFVGRTTGLESSGSDLFPGVSIAGIPVLA